MLNVTDYKNTADAKAADFERLEDIAGGQSHRQITQARLEELKLARGGALTLDNLEYGGRQAYMRPSGRGTTTGGRGGGNAGRGGGRSIPSAPRLVPMRWISTQLTVMNRDRPLDPAVDQSRPYVYGGKGSNRGGYQGTLTQSHVTKPAASSSTAPVGPRKAQPSKRGSHSHSKTSSTLASDGVDGEPCRTKHLQSSCQRWDHDWEDDLTFCLLNDVSDSHSSFHARAAAL